MNGNRPPENPNPPTSCTQEDFNDAFEYNPGRPSGT